MSTEGTTEAGGTAETGSGAGGAGTAGAGSGGVGTGGETDAGSGTDSDLSHAASAAPATTTARNSELALRLTTRERSMPRAGMALIWLVTIRSTGRARPRNYGRITQKAGAELLQQPAAQGASALWVE